MDPIRCKRVGSGSYSPVHVVGRYALYSEIATGGMATVHLGTMVGSVGFSKTVAIKRLHPQFAKNPDFVAMLLDEGRLAARVQHPNVVSTLDVVALEGELFLVMEYVQGETLWRLRRAADHRQVPVPPRIAAAIMVGALHGLHAAHEATDELLEPLHVVHRDVSPQNIMVGIDGVSRVLDFGVAKACGRATETRSGDLERQTRVHGARRSRSRERDARDGCLRGLGRPLGGSHRRHRLFAADSQGETLQRVLNAEIDPPSVRVRGLPVGLDAVTMRGLCPRPWRSGSPLRRRDGVRALERTIRLAATASEVGEYVVRMAGPSSGRARRTRRG